MNLSGGALPERDDVAIIQACVERPTQSTWATFFKCFEERFRSWIRHALRDGSEEDREDAYQDLAEQLLRGRILPHIDLDRDSGPVPYLRTIVENAVHKQHQRKARLAEEPLEEEDNVSSHLSRLADRAAPVPANELFRRLKNGLEQSEIGPEKKLAFKALLESENIREVTERTKFSRSTTYRYVKELDKLAHSVLNVPYKE